MEQQESCETPATTGVESDKEHPTSMAPPDYRPTLESRTMVHDDEILDLPAMMDWRSLFAGGSNRAHWVRTDQDASPHFVEGISLDGRYEAHGPDYAEQFKNPCDALWKAGGTCGSAGPGDNAARRKENRK